MCECGRRLWPAHANNKRRHLRATVVVGVLRQWVATEVCGRCLTKRRRSRTQAAQREATHHEPAGTFGCQRCVLVVPRQLRVELLSKPAGSRQRQLPKHARSQVSTDAPRRLSSTAVASMQHAAHWPADRPLQAARLRSGRAGRGGTRGAARWSSKPLHRRRAAAGRRRTQPPPLPAGARRGSACARAPSQPQGRQPAQHSSVCRSAQAADRRPQRIGAPAVRCAAQASAQTTAPRPRLRRTKASRRRLRAAAPALRR